MKYKLIIAMLKYDNDDEPLFIEHDSQLYLIGS